MIAANQRASEKHRFVLVANQYLTLINKPQSLPIYQIGAITEMINALYEANLWKKFIALYPFIGDNNANKNSLNLIDPYKYQIAWTGSLVFNEFGVTGNGGYGNTNIPLIMLQNFSNIHLSSYVRTTINGASGKGRLIGLNTKYYLKKIKDVGALELNFSKESGIVGFVYNIINDKGGFGMSYSDMNANSITGNGFIIGNSNDNKKKLAKCYLNGSIFGAQFPLLPTEVHKANAGTLTVLGDAQEPPLRANICFSSVGYGLSDNEILIFNKIIQSFQASMRRLAM